MRLATLFAALLLPVLASAINAPTNLSVTQNPDGSATLSWVNDPTAQGVNMWQATSCSALPANTVGAGKSAIGGGTLPGGVITSYTIAAPIPVGTCWEANNWSCPPTGACPESGPSNQVALGPVPTTNGTITLTWSAPTLNADGSALTNLAGFNIYRAAAPFTATSGAGLIKSVGAPVLTYADTGLATGTYYYGLTATSSTGAESALSAVGAGATIAAATPTIPAAPGNVNMTCSVPVGSGLSCTVH